MVGATAVLVVGDHQERLLPVLAFDQRIVDFEQELLAQADVVRRVLIAGALGKWQERRLDERVGRQCAGFRLGGKIGDAQEMGIKLQIVKMWKLKPGQRDEGPRVVHGPGAAVCFQDIENRGDVEVERIVRPVVDAPFAVPVWTNARLGHVSQGADANQASHTA